MLKEGSLPATALARVERDIEANIADLKQIEHAFKSESTDDLLLKKYEALLKDRHILLEGRNDAISKCLCFPPYFHCWMPFLTYMHVCLARDWTYNSSLVSNCHVHRNKQKSWDAQQGQDISVLSLNLYP